MHASEMQFYILNEDHTVYIFSHTSVILIISLSNFNHNYGLFF